MRSGRENPMTSFDWSTSWPLWLYHDYHSLITIMNHWLLKNRSQPLWFMAFQTQNVSRLPGATSCFGRWKHAGANFAQWELLRKTSQVFWNRALLIWKFFPLASDSLQAIRSYWHRGVGNLSHNLLVCCGFTWFYHIYTQQYRTKIDSWSTSCVTLGLLLASLQHRRGQESEVQDGRQKQRPEKRGSPVQVVRAVRLWSQGLELVGEEFRVRVAKSTRDKGGGPGPKKKRHDGTVTKRRFPGEQPDEVESSDKTDKTEKVQEIGDAKAVWW